MIDNPMDLNSLERIFFGGVQAGIPGRHSNNQYSSNTSSIAFVINDCLFICDAGTGIRPISTKFDGHQYRAVFLFISHSHWDHIQGFPFCHYLNLDINLYLFSPKSSHIDALLRQFDNDNFPVALHDLPCTLTQGLTIQEIEEISKVSISCIQTNHHGECYGFRFNHMTIDITYIPDNQLHDTNHASFNSMVTFCRHTDVLIHDAQLVPSDMPHKKHWGHSLYTDMLRLSEAAGVNHAVLFHHDPCRTLTELNEMLDHAKVLAPSVHTHLAKEMGLPNV